MSETTDILQRYKVQFTMFEHQNLWSLSDVVTNLVYPAIELKNNSLK